MDSAPPQDAPRPSLAVIASRGAVAIALLTVLPVPPAGFAAPADSWRADADFCVASAAIESWLAETAIEPDRAIADWRVASAEAPRAARLGGAIRLLAAMVEERLASPPSDRVPAWLVEAGDVSGSLRLAFAEELASHQRYDACLNWLEGIEPTGCYAPTLVLYLRAVASHQLVDDEAARTALDQLTLLVNDHGAERLGTARQWVLDRLVRDLKAETDPLASVARRMIDAERRLAMSDPGKSTRDGQQTVLDELDKLIEALEDQRQKQQQQQAAAGGAGGTAEPGAPAEESRPSELKGPGEVDRKRLIAGDAWGALPSAERERLTQAITRDYPPHYRTLVEDYFRTLAAEADQATTPESGDR